ncbi:MAG TPA: hypothetical protein PLY87_15115 [Planctomycetaceae bacterium]|nr:hypothetical protein [Planctomycetaceae bacterium]
MRLSAERLWPDLRGAVLESAVLSESRMSAVGASLADGKAAAVASPTARSSKAKSDSRQRGSAASHPPGITSVADPGTGCTRCTAECTRRVVTQQKTSGADLRPRRLLGERKKQDYQGYRVALGIRPERGRTT